MYIYFWTLLNVLQFQKKKLNVSGNVKILTAWEISSECFNGE